MKIHPIITNNALSNIFYILEYGEKKALIIDPCDTQLAQDFLTEQGLTLEQILITHEHYDHYQGVEKLKCPAVYAGEITSQNIPISVSHIFGDDDRVFVYEDFQIKARFTPGHAAGHMMFELIENQRVTAVFSGDVLFSGGVGHTRAGSSEDLYHSLQKFETYKDEVIIYSGHDYFQSNSLFIQEQYPEYTSKLDIFSERNKTKVYFTTLGEERDFNPFLTATKDEFLRLRNLKNTY